MTRGGPFLLFFGTYVFGIPFFKLLVYDHCASEESVPGPSRVVVPAELVINYGKMLFININMI